MPFLKSLILSILVTLSVLGCSQHHEIPPVEFSLHTMKIKYDADAGFLSVADTISLQFNRNADHILFFLHDSLQVNRICIGNQEITPEPVSERILNSMPNFSRELEVVLDRAQVVMAPIPKSLYPKNIEIRYSGSVDISEMHKIAWHPIAPGCRASFHITALLPTHVQPVCRPPFVLIDDSDGWRLWQGRLNTPDELCSVQFLSKQSEGIYESK